MHSSASRTADDRIAARTDDLRDGLAWCGYLTSHLEINIAIKDIPIATIAMRYSMEVAEDEKRTWAHEHEDANSATSSPQ